MVRQLGPTPAVAGRAVGVPDFEAVPRLLAGEGLAMTLGLCVLILVGVVIGCSVEIPRWADRVQRRPRA